MRGKKNITALLALRDMLRAATAYADTWRAFLEEGVEEHDLALSEKALEIAALNFARNYISTDAAEFSRRDAVLQAHAKDDRVPGWTEARFAVADRHAARALGKKGGSARTPAKVAAARANGKRGGRPASSR